ncbi:unnamed protein product [Amoebophrya sp. A120]|nr:unnamed protein product [Amoebophrya sp. A120]|eukprot:GSA120T00013044001.1
MPVVRGTNCDLEYFVSGKKTLADGAVAPVITFIHGAGGNALSWWRTTPHFVCSSVPGGAVTPESGQQTYYTISVSIRGWGASRLDGEGDAILENFKPQHYADDLLAILDAENVGQTAIVAHSYGGFVGVLATFAAPERITSLVLVSTALGLKFSDETEWKWFVDYFTSQCKTIGSFTDFDADRTLADVKERLLLVEENEEEENAENKAESKVSCDTGSSDSTAETMPAEPPPRRRRRPGNKFAAVCSQYRSAPRDARMAEGVRMWIKKDPEMMHFRMLLSAASAQIDVMEVLKPPKTLDLLMGPVFENSIPVDDFRARINSVLLTEPVRIHVICAEDDTVLPWEWSALLATRVGAESLKVFPTGKGDHSVMLFSPKEFCKAVREALES